MVEGGHSAQQGCAHATHRHSKTSTHGSIWSWTHFVVLHVFVLFFLWGFLCDRERSICLVSLVNKQPLHHICAYHVCTVDEWFPGLSPRICLAFRPLTEEKKLSWGNYYRLNEILSEQSRALSQTLGVGVGGGGGDA